MTDESVSKPLVSASVASRQAILDRVRAATSAFDPPAVSRDYRRAGADPQPAAEMIEVFVDRLIDYKAVVTRCPLADVSAAVAAFVAAESATRVVVPDGFPHEWLATATGSEAGMVRLDDTEPLSVDELDGADGVVTTCAVAVAETGTIVLDGGAGQGRRALTLLPDLHIVVVTSDQLVARVPDALERLDPRRPLTWISGPSATSDIELNRVEGVHGPRRLRVVVAEST